MWVLVLVGHVFGQQTSLESSAFHHISHHLSQDGQDLFEVLCQDLVLLRVNRDSPFSDKYWNASQDFADDVLLTLELLMRQDSFVLSPETIGDRLYAMLPIGLLSRVSSRQSSADHILRRFAPPDGYSAAWSNPKLCGPKLPPKLVLILSPFNEIQVPPWCVFESVGHQTGSLWVTRFFDFHTTAVSHPRAKQNLEKHQRAIPLLQNFRFIDNTVSSAYFGSSYVDPDSDAGVKLAINVVRKRPKQQHLAGNKFTHEMSKKCNRRESNPGHPRGRRISYH
eukprot:c20359_g1_i2.p1 GENE.c20359_g1_i2~~c20359_g1_i2.p1  ORF type:complete len:280 (+),score=36.58 c20359_g1_i2:31-870(+)